MYVSIRALAYYLYALPMLLQWHRAVFLRQHGSCKTV